MFLDGLGWSGLRWHHGNLHASSVAQGLKETCLQAALLCQRDGRERCWESNEASAGLTRAFVKRDLQSLTIDCELCQGTGPTCYVRNFTKSTFAPQHARSCRSCLNAGCLRHLAAATDSSGNCLIACELSKCPNQRACFHLEGQESSVVLLTPVRYSLDAHQEALAAPQLTSGFMVGHPLDLQCPLPTAKPAQERLQPRESSAQLEQLPFSAAQSHAWLNFARLAQVRLNSGFRS